MDIKELEIGAAWGNIAVKLWGHPEDQAVLTVHGIQDNAGSFDDLIPLLPKYFYICIDLPGHGKSSHFPAHLPIHTMDYLLVYKIVMDYFQRDKYIIMGHSYGGQLGILFTQLYPGRVEKLIMLDTLHTNKVFSENFAKYVEYIVNTHLEMEKKRATRSPPKYTYGQALEKVIKNRPSPLTEKAAKNLLKRMLIPVGNDEFQFSFDQRLKQFVTLLHDPRYAVDTLKATPIRCPVLIVFGKENEPQRIISKEILEHMEKQKNFTIKYVPGHHDVHQTNPERVAPLINQFLNVQKSKL